MYICCRFLIMRQWISAGGTSNITIGVTILSNIMYQKGTYATDPFDGAVRIQEFKAMVQGLHRAGIGVVLDVVFNHTFFTEDSAFHKTMPYYYHRTNLDGSFPMALCVEMRPHVNGLCADVSFWILSCIGQRNTTLMAFASI